MDLSRANVFVTGGAGTLGRAIARRRKEEGWKGKLTVYSTDNHKHDFMRRLYPDVTFVQGDIRSEVTLRPAMAGHDVAIHAAAVKVIPDSELWSIDTFDVNVNGSLNFAVCAMAVNIEHVLGISTDKACHPANAYGATKMLMEKAWQELARSETETQFHLVRYGNVLQSTGSVIEWWKKAAEAGQAIKITDPEMTRFWLSPRQAVDYVLQALDGETGTIYIPHMPALSIGKLAKYVVGDCKTQMIPVRPGEKKHETLLTIDECPRAFAKLGYFILAPSTYEVMPYHIWSSPYSSDVADELTETELAELLND